MPGDLKAGSEPIVDIKYGTTQIVELRLGTKRLWKLAPDPVGTGYWCNLEAGQGEFTERGWRSPALFTPCGYIDRQPVPGHDLMKLTIASGGVGTVAVEGSAPALLAGRSVYINGGGGYPLHSVTDLGSQTYAEFDAWPTSLRIDWWYLMEIR